LKTPIKHNVDELQINQSSDFREQEIDIQVVKMSFKWRSTSHDNVIGASVISYPKKVKIMLTYCKQWSIIHHSKTHGCCTENYRWTIRRLQTL